MWNYLFFIAYIKWKKETDYTGIESYVNQKYNQSEYDWFPFNKAREL